MSLKNFKAFDYIIIAAFIAVAVLGFLAFKGKNHFAKSPVEATKKITFQVMLKSVSVTDAQSPFKIGEKSFITIRNVPYTELQIIDVLFQPKKFILPINNAKQPFAVIDDMSQPFQYDFIVTLIDEAKITKDGPVVGGNKIKIGLPIILEGFNYRIGGTISNVQVLENSDLPLINKYVEENKKSQQDVSLFPNKPLPAVKEEAKEEAKEKVKEEK